MPAARAMAFDDDLGDGIIRLASADAPLAVDGKRMTAKGLLCTENRDRQGDVIVVGGVECDDHRANPIVMLEHGVYHPLPIGVTTDPDTGAYTVEAFPELGQMWQTTKFSQSTRTAEQVFALVEEGMIRANSIHVTPITYEVLPADPENGWPEKPPGKVPYRYVTNSRLVEASWAVIPVNPEAVRRSLSRKSFAGSPLDPAIRRALEAHRPPVAYWRTSAPKGVTRAADPIDRLCAAKDSAMAKAWNEADHPRGEGGKFGSGSGSSETPAEKPTEKPAEPKKDDAPKPKAKAAWQRRKDRRGFSTSSQTGDHQKGDRVHVEGYGPGTFKKWTPSGDVVVTIDKDGDDVRVHSTRVKPAPPEGGDAKKSASAKAYTPADSTAPASAAHTPPTKPQTPEGRTMAASPRLPHGAVHLQELHKGFCNMMHNCRKSAELLDNEGVKGHSDKCMDALKSMAADTEAAHNERYPQAEPLDHEAALKSMDPESDKDAGDEGEKDAEKSEADADADADAGDASGGTDDLMESEAGEGGKDDDADGKAMSALDSSEGGALAGKPEKSSVEGGEWRDAEEDEEEREAKKALSELRALNDANERRLTALGL